MNLSGNPATDFQNVLDLIGKTAQPLDMVHHGTMNIYRVERASGQNVITGTSWTMGGLSSKPFQGASALGGISLAEGQSAYVVEVYYNYRSFFLGNHYSPTLKSISIF